METGITQILFINSLDIESVDMKDENFPGLFLVANKVAIDYQNNFKLALKMNLVTLVAAAVLSFIPLSHWTIALLQLIALLTTLACSIYLATQKPEKLWYSGRALAESIKTLTWRYISKAEPFNKNDKISKNEFIETLNKAIQQNREVCQRYSNHLGDEQITPKMTEMRSQELQIRKQNYHLYRIKDQNEWYKKKAKYNQDKSKIFFILLIITNVIAVIFAATKIAFPDFTPWPTDIFIATAASLLAWMQAKKFSELAASYTLAAHEINIIKSLSLEEMTEEEFSIFVGDAENAFSREHTQWVARKDI